MSEVSICSRETHSALLDQYLQELKTLSAQAPVLDLACGSGRNGLYLDQQGIETVFADKDESALAAIKGKIQHNSRVWPVDLEQPGLNPLANQQFSAIIVFRYLHRPLFEAIKQAIMPGGLIIYQTFNIHQAELGRPKNPNFLLKPKELQNVFANWQQLHYFEGIENGSAIASIVARKPTPRPQ